ncbi:MAG: hypothetical protein M3R08_09685, partial [Bacteroidota bacterium]|nr:hypothetical protein [Bacteroidota bacterium]
ILSMAFFYLFTRAMFNRYIAMLVLALIASSAPLIEYSALAQGYSFTWLFLILALVLGRHFVKENSATSAVLIGIMLALGMWTMTTMIYPAITIYIYLLLYILMRYQGSIRKRLDLLMISFAIFLATMIGLYFPIVSHHGLAHLFEHSAVQDLSWSKFAQQHQDAAFALWVAIADTTGSIVAAFGIIAVLFSAFISGKYRLIMFSVALGAIPLVLLQAWVAPPPVWYYTLYLFHLGSGIALFYLLKLIQEKLYPKLGKRTRTAVASVVIFAGLTVAGYKVIIERIDRFAEAEKAGQFLGEVMEPADKIFVVHPWDAPIRFHARSHGIGRDRFMGAPQPDSWVYVLVSRVNSQNVRSVLNIHRLASDQLDTLRMVKDWERIEIFAARYRGGSSLGQAQ